MIEKINSDIFGRAFVALPVSLIGMKPTLLSLVAGLALGVSLAAAYFATIDRPRSLSGARLQELQGRRSAEIDRLQNRGDRQEFTYKLELISARYEAEEKGFVSDLTKIKLEEARFAWEVESRKTNK